MTSTGSHATDSTGIRYEPEVQSSVPSLSRAELGALRAGGVI